jgi:hypothetical protein
MKARLVAAGWLGVAAIAGGAHWLFEHGLASLGRADADAGASHLSAQSCDDAELVLTLSASPVELGGVLRGRVTASGPLRGLALVLGDAVVVDGVTLGGKPAAPPSGLLADLVARPAALARFVVAEPVPTPAEFEVKFRVPVDGANLPTFVEPAALVRVVEPMRLAGLTVELPEGGALVEFVAGGEPRQRGPGRQVLGAWDDAHDPLLIGAAEWRNGSGSLASQRFVAARGQLPDAALEAAARAIVERSLDGKPLAPRTLVLAGGEAARAFPRRAASWRAAPLPRRAPELAYALLEAALPTSADDDELVRALPAALLLDGIAPDLAAPLRSYAPFTIPESRRAGLRAWTALVAIHGERARAAERDAWSALAAGVAARPALLDESGPAALAAWALAGIEARFDGLVREVRSSRSELHGDWVVSPPPPPGVTFRVPIVFVGHERAQVESLEISGARTPLPPFALRETPLVVVVDPQRLLPRRDARDAVYPLEFAPTAFAVASDASALAVALTRATGGDDHGVFVMERGDDARLSLRRWNAAPVRTDAMRWILPRRFLALEGADGAARVLDCSDGAFERCDAPLLVSPRSGVFVTESERAPGCFAHVVHDLASGLERPLPAPRRSPVRFVECDDSVEPRDEIVAEAADGRAALLDLHGVERFRLPWLAASVRDVRRTDFGYALVLEALDSSRLVLLRPDGERLEEIVVPGRVRGWTFVAETGLFYVVAQDGVRGHVVVRTRYGGGRAAELYRGPDRPLPDVLTQKGVVLVDAESDAARRDEPRRLLFLPFDREGDAERAARPICAEAFLAPPPVLASAGRYLYYLRAQSGPKGLPGPQRPRVLTSYDFLTGREDPLETEAR